MAKQSTLTNQQSRLIEKVTRAELNDIISKLRIKANRYADRDLAEMANRLISVYNMGLPDTGLLTHVSCIKEWMWKEGFRSMSDAAKIMGWNRDTIRKYKDDTDMENHAIVFNRFYVKIGNKKAGG